MDNNNKNNNNIITNNNNNNNNNCDIQWFTIGQYDENKTATSEEFAKRVNQ